ncbi:MAG: aminotransferase class I/II-fold pyridoxal phosphate-dependent enzyme [Clostridia bacterium]|nr:aminotransferase class I/II-fold pyridoxal phosphate-dependent enzyme [Clostridia bacterium]
MPDLAQENAPLYEALEQFRQRRVVPFDVPGHKRGRGNPELVKFLGEKCLSIDVNSMKPLDNLGHPSSVILEAEQLAAEAFGAAHAYFIVGGTTAAVQSMLLYACREGEKIILPRNVHQSVVNTLVLSGAMPIYVDPEVEPRLGIPLGMRLAAVEAAIAAHPDAKAVLVNNPTYYGVCSRIEAIAELAHRHNMLLLADEAHGAHFYFGADFPAAAMAAGADLAAVSMHKSGGSLTQSSILLAGAAIDAGGLRQTINLTQTTSASYLLLASLDLSRRNLALNGREIFAKVRQLSAYARDEINLIGGYVAYGKELINHDSIYDFDDTKLSVFTLDIGLAGIEVYDLLRDEYDIQAEFGDVGNMLAYISIGDRPRDIERLVNALAEIKRRFGRTPIALPVQAYPEPRLMLSPQQAYFAAKTTLPISASAGRVSGESVLCYPPGIPVLAPGEMITPEIIDYIRFSKDKGCLVTGTRDQAVELIDVVEE